MADSGSSDTTTFKVQCHCKSNDFDITVPNSDLPLLLTMCQCDSCRHCTGMVLPGYIPFPPSLGIKPPDLSKLTGYKTSPGMTRYFCNTCGASVCSIETKDDIWYLPAGLIDKAGDRVERVTCWADDTKDGGFSIFLDHEDEKSMKHYRLGHLPSQGAEEVTEEQKKEFQSKSVTALSTNSTEVSRWPQKDEKIRCRCHCGGVDFFVTRPDPDLPKPEPSRANPEPNRWWLNGYKYNCLPCPCESCRRCSGFELSTLAFVPKTNVIWNDGKPMEFNEGTLRTYHSTPGKVEREFCGVCGALIFYRAPENRKSTGVLDIGIGLFDTGDSRVEDWLYWIPDKDYETDSLDPEFNRILSKGINKWNSQVP